MPSPENLNAQIPLAQYQQPAAKPLLQYGWILGKPFLSTIARLREGDIVIDNGAGFGAAMLGLARHFKTTSLAINAQDFWGEVYRVSQSDFRITFTAPDKGRQTCFRVGTFLAKDLVSLGEAVGLEGLEIVVEEDLVKTPSRMQQYREQVAGHLQATLERMNDLRKRGYFEYHVGFSENILPYLFVKAKVVVDVFGGYFYSGNRMLQLERIYDVLAPGGVAFIALGEGRHHPVDYVRDTNGKKHKVIEFLVERYSDIFLLAPGGQKSLPYVFDGTGFRPQKPDDPKHWPTQTGVTSPLLLIRKTVDLPWRSPLHLSEKMTHYSGNQETKMLFPDGVLFQER